VYLNWGNSKCIPIIQNKHYIPLVLVLIWKDPKTLGIIDNENSIIINNENSSLKSDYILYLVP